MSDLIETTTIFGNGLSRGRVWIKVCNINFQGELNDHSTAKNLVLRKNPINQKHCESDAHYDQSFKHDYIPFSSLA